MITALITATVSVLGLLGVFGLVGCENKTEDKQPMSPEQESQFETAEFKVRYED